MGGGVGPDAETSGAFDVPVPDPASVFTGGPSDRTGGAELVLGRESPELTGPPPSTVAERAGGGEAAELASPFADTGVGAALSRLGLALGELSTGGASFTTGGAS